MILSEHPDITEKVYGIIIYDVPLYVCLKYYTSYDILDIALSSGWYNHPNTTCEKYTINS